MFLANYRNSQVLKTKRGKFIVLSVINFYLPVRAAVSDNGPAN